MKLQTRKNAISNCFGDKQSTIYPFSTDFCTEFMCSLHANGHRVLHIGYDAHAHAHAHVPIKLTAIECYLVDSADESFQELCWGSVLSIQFSFDFNSLLCVDLVGKYFRRAILIGPIVYTAHKPYVLLYGWHVLNKYTKLFWFCKQR